MSRTPVRRHHRHRTPPSQPADASDAADANGAADATPASAAADGHAKPAKDVESPDWTTLDYDESEDAKVSADVTDGAPNPDLASDDSETVSVRIPSQAKRPREERVGR